MMRKPTRGVIVGAALTVMVIPSDAVIRAIGAGGYAAALVGWFAFAALMAATVLGLNDPARHRHPIRGVLWAFWFSVLVSYVVMDRSNLTLAQEAAADRLLMQLVVISGVALLAAVPLVWGWGMSGLDVTMALVGYLVAIAGVTVGFHRHLTHGSFKARRGLRIALAVAGCLAIEGAPTKWVADHRRHHAFTDREGDPHSPWRYGTGVRALAKGLLYAHCGWLLNREVTNKSRFAPDLLADRGIHVVDRLFIPLIVMSLLAPAVVGGLVTGSWVGALTGFFWAGLVRMALLHPHNIFRSMHK